MDSFSYEKWETRPSILPSQSMLVIISFQTTMDFLIHPHLKLNTIFSASSPMKKFVVSNYFVTKPTSFLLEDGNQIIAIQVNICLSFLQWHFNPSILFSISVQSNIFFIIWDTAQQWASFHLCSLLKFILGCNWTDFQECLRLIQRWRFAALSPMKRTVISCYWHEKVNILQPITVKMNSRAIPSTGIQFSGFHWTRQFCHLIFDILGITPSSHYLEGYWKNMANETTMHNTCSVAYMFVFTSSPQQIKTELRFTFVHRGGQEKLDFACEE